MYGEKKRHHDVSGFSLIEVMVALVVLSLIVGGALSFVAQSSRYAGDAQDRLYASIAADNEMTRALVAVAPLEEVEETVECPIKDRRFQCQITTVDAGVGGIFRIDVEVRSADTGQLLSVATTLKAAGRL